MNDMNDPYLAAVAGVVLGVAQKADAAHAVAAEHLERLAGVLVAVGGRCRDVTRRQLGAETHYPVFSGGLEAVVVSAAVITQVLSTVEAMMRRLDDRRRTRRRIHSNR